MCIRDSKDSTKQKEGEISEPLNLLQNQYYFQMSCNHYFCSQNHQIHVPKVFLKEQQVFAKPLLSSKMVFWYSCDNRKCSLCSQVQLQQQPKKNRKKQKKNRLTD